jgi:hypothetical protein
MHIYEIRELIKSTERKLSQIERLHKRAESLRMLESSLRFRGHQQMATIECNGIKHSLTFFNQGYQSEVKNKTFLPAISLFRRGLLSEVSEIEDEIKTIESNILKIA